MGKARNTAKKIQYVIPVGNGWAVKAAGSIKFTIITDSKKEAVSVAKDIAKRDESALIIYGKDGRILLSNSYSKKGKAVAKV
jgi:hypothetical protein